MENGRARFFMQVLFIAAGDFRLTFVTSVTSVHPWCSQLISDSTWWVGKVGGWMFRLFVLVLAGKVSADVTWCFNLLETDPSELLFAALVELYYRREMYVHIQQCFLSLTLLYMWNRCTWNQRWYRRANGLHISHLGINIEIRELHRFYKSNFPAIWRFALCPIRAMKIGRWTEQCHGWTSLRRVGNRENWWKPIAVSPSCSLGIKNPSFGNAKWRSSTACHARIEICLREFQLSTCFIDDFASDWRSLHDWSIFSGGISGCVSWIATSRWSKHFWTLCFSCIWQNLVLGNPLQEQFTSQVQSSCFLYLVLFDLVLPKFSYRIRPDFDSQGASVQTAALLQQKWATSAGGSAKSFSSFPCLKLVDLWFAYCARLFWICPKAPERHICCKCTSLAFCLTGNLHLDAKFDPDSARQADGRLPWATHQCVFWLDLDARNSRMHHEFLLFKGCLHSLRSQVVTFRLANYNRRQLPIISKRSRRSVFTFRL